MKKQKFMKLTAFTSSPSLENSFSAPATHDGEVSVVFSGKNVKIHGWDGSVWSVIYAWDSVDKEHTFDNTFNNYFLESLTGQEETMSVSFFSVDRYQGSTPSLAGVTREVKLYDVDEVPIYTASDAGKMLTIMSDGSLRWLGASVTWMIDGSPVPGAPAADYIEDRNDLTLGAGTTIVDGIVHVGNDVTSSLQVGGVGAAGPFRSLFETYEFSVSFFMKTTNPGNAMMVTDCWAGTFNGWFVYLSSTGHLQFVNGAGGGELSSPAPANQLRDGNWHHVTITVAPDSTNKVYIDGVEFCSINLGGNRPFHASSALTFGWIGQGQVGPFGGYPLDGQMDQILIHDSTLSAAEALDLYNNSSSPPVVVTVDNGLVVDNDLFNSAERIVLGTSPVVDASNDKVYTFDGTGGFRYFNGVKYDPYDVSGIPGVQLEYEGSARTYSIWFKADNLTGNKMLFGKWSRWGAFGKDKGWGIRLKDGTIQTWVDSSGNNGITNLDTYNPANEGHPSLLAETWYHLVITFDGGVAKYYLNGELKRTDTTAGTTVQTAHYGNSNLDAADIDGNSTYSLYYVALTLGTNTVETNNGAISSPFVGQLAYPEIYYSALPVENILEIYNSQLNTLAN